MSNDNIISYFAQTDSRSRRTPFGIKASDRTKHVYVIGKTGMGKSTLLENMAIQDIKNGAGFAFIDPHGKTAELLLDYIPENRVDDVLYFAPFDLDYPIAFNVMEDIGADKRHLVASGLMSTFKKIWVDAWSARMEYILNNTVLALLEYPGATLLDINRMLANKDYRKKVVENISDVSVRSFWVDEFAKYTERFAAEATPAIQNKVGQFTSNPLIRNIIGQPKSTFDIRKMMDERKIIIVNLSKGKVGETNANLLGSMMITKIYLAAMSRADVHERELNKLPNFYLYVDEFQSFANESFANILSEARKYKLNLTIAHQYIEQMSEEVRAAVFGNVGTMVTFRVGAFDAEVLEKEFAPQFTAEDLVNLGIYQVYLKLMIDGVSSFPFSATTLPPIERADISFKPEIIEASRAHFARPRMVVENEIKTAHMPDIKPAEIRRSAEPVSGSMPTNRPMPNQSQDLKKVFQPAVEKVNTNSHPPKEALRQTNQVPHSRPDRPSYYSQGQHSNRDREQGGRGQVNQNVGQRENLPKNEAISLKTLQGGINPVNRSSASGMPNKNQRPEEASELKKALANLIGNAKGSENKEPPKKVFNQPTQSHQNLQAKDTPNNQVRQDNAKPLTSDIQIKTPSGRNEVPEEVLRKILDVKTE